MPARVKYFADCGLPIDIGNDSDRFISIIEAGDPGFFGKFEIGIAGKFNE